MNSILSFSKKHAAALIWHLIYAWYIIDLFNATDTYLQIPDSGLPYAIFTFIILVVDIFNAIFRKTDKVFYLCMGLLVIALLIICNLVNH